MNNIDWQPIIAFWTQGWGLPLIIFIVGMAAGFIARIKFKLAIIGIFLILYFSITATVLFRDKPMNERPSWAGPAAQNLKNNMQRMEAETKSVLEPYLKD